MISSLNMLWIKVREFARSAISKRRWWKFSGGLLIVLLAACSDQRFGLDRPTDFKLPGLLDDQIYSLAALKGKVVYLTFWASWCAPCRQEMPFLVKLHQQYAEQGFEVLALSADENPREGVEFIKPFAVPFQVAHDVEGKVREQYGVEAIPTHFIIDREGRVTYSHMGFKDGDQNKIKKQVGELLSLK